MRDASSCSTKMYEGFQCRERQTFGNINNNSTLMIPSASSPSRTFSIKCFGAELLLNKTPSNLHETTPYSIRKSRSSTSRVPAPVFMKSNGTLLFNAICGVLSQILAISSSSRTSLASARICAIRYNLSPTCEDSLRFSLRIRPIVFTLIPNALHTCTSPIARACLIRSMECAGSPFSMFSASSSLFAMLPLIPRISHTT